MKRIIGFKFHSGVMACGRRKARRTLDDVVPKRSRAADAGDLSGDRQRGEYRLADPPLAGFGADAMILGERHDPFWRQSVRVSMGTIFTLPIVQSDDLLRDLQAAEGGVGRGTGRDRARSRRRNHSEFAAGIEAGHCSLEARRRDWKSSASTRAIAG